MRARLLFSLLSLLFVIPAVSSAKTLLVPSTYSTIQAAIDASSAGDSVIVSDGHYMERISFRGKAITVASRFIVDNLPSHITNTIIDGDPSVLGAADTGSVVRIIAVQAGTAVLKGFTIQKGTGSPLAGLTGLKGGGGVFCSFTYALIDHCIVQNCTADLGSCVMSFQGSETMLRACTVQGNGMAHGFSFLVTRDTCVLGSAETQSVGLLDFSSTTVGNIKAGSSGRMQFTDVTVNGTITARDTAYLEASNCRITGLTSLANETYATFKRCTVGGVKADTAYGMDAATLDTCLVTGASSTNNADIYFGHSTILKAITCADGVVTLDSSIVSVNGGKIVYCGDTVMAAVSAYCSDFYGYDGPDWFDCSNIFLSTDKLISVNPQFCNPSLGDYHIADTSMCAPSNNSCKALMGAFGVACGCCTGSTGNVNMSGIVDLSDLSALVSFLTGGGYVLPCRGEANVNAAGIVDLSDLSALVSYLTGGGYVLPQCF